MDDFKVFGLYETTHKRKVIREESAWTRPSVEAKEWDNLGEKLIKVTFHKDMVCPESRIECSDEEYVSKNPEVWYYRWEETKYTYDIRELARDSVIIKKVEDGSYLIVPIENTAVYAVEFPNNTPISEGEQNTL